MAKMRKTPGRSRFPRPSGGGEPNRKPGKGSMSRGNGTTRHPKPKGGRTQPRPC